MSDTVVGLDLGGTKIMTAVVDAEGHVLHKVFTLSEVSKGPDAVLDRMAGAIHEAVEGAKLSMSDVAAIGIGSPGPLDQDTGIVTDSPNMPGWHDVNVKQHIARATGRPVFLDNDGNVGTLAEQAFGAGRGVQNLIGLFLGTGIGGGVMINGKLWHGFSKQAGELGHVVVDVNGPMCGCGQRGCVEALASRQAMCRQIAEAVKAGRESVITATDAMNIRTTHLADALAAGDDLVREVMTSAMEYLGVAMASMAHVVSPEMFVIGGGIIDALTDELLDVAAESAGKRALRLVMDDVKVVRAELKEDAPVLGAAALARQGLAG